jgi:hypothetical protein
MYVLGGRTPLDPFQSNPPAFGASQLHADVWSSDDNGGSWSQIAADDDSHWPARAYFQAVTLGKAMYVLGGQNFRTDCESPAPGVPPPPSCSDFFNDVWKSTDGSHWERLTEAAPWAGRAGLSAAVLHGKIYVFGGSVNDDSAVIGPGGAPPRVYFNDVWRSSDGTDWELVTQHAPWIERAGAAAAVKGGWLYLLGGERGFLPTPEVPQPYFNDVWRTRDGRHWSRTTRDAGWSPRPGHQCVTVRPALVCFGGFGQPENPRDVWVSLTGRRWYRTPGTPWNATSSADVKYDFDAVVAPGPRGLRSVYTFGGDRETFDFSDPFNYTRVDNDVWRYTPLLELLALRAG